MPYIISIPEGKTGPDYLVSLGGDVVAEPNAALNTDEDALVCFADVGILKTIVLAFDENEITNINQLPGDDKTWYLLPRDIAWKEAGFTKEDQVREKNMEDGKKAKPELEGLKKAEAAYHEMADLSKRIVDEDETMQGIGIVFILPNGRIMNVWHTDGLDGFHKLLGGLSIMQAEMSSKALEADRSIKSLMGGGLAQALQAILGGIGQVRVSEEGDDYSSSEDSDNPFG